MGPVSVSPFSAIRPPSKLRTSTVQFEYCEQTGDRTLLRIRPFGWFEVNQQKEAPCSIAFAK